MGSFFEKAYNFFSKKKWLGVFFLVLIAVLLTAIISKIEFDDDISSLIPASEEAKKTQEILKSIAFADKIIVNIHRKNDTPVEELTHFASAFLDSLQQTSSPFLKRIQGKLSNEDLPNTLNLVYNNLPLFLDDNDYTFLEGQLKKDSVAKIAQQHYHTFISPSGIVATKTIRKDPFGLSFVALKKLQQLGIGDNFKLKDGFLIDEKEENILLFITPTFASGETDKNTLFANQLYTIQKQFEKTYTNKVSVDYFGAALVAVANAQQIRKDIKFTASIALIALFIVLILFYKKLSLPIILFLPTLFGGLLSVAILVLIRGQISAISLGIGSVLLGVTLDYSLHVLTHIRNGKSLNNLFYKVAPSILMSSLTTASAFLCLLFLKSQALQDLGIFAAISVLGASVFALLFIPQVYQLKAIKIKRNTFLDRLAAYNFYKNKWIVGGVTTLLIISLFTYKNIRFNQDITKMNYESEVLVQARERLEALTDIGSKSIYLSTYGKNRETVLQRNDTLFKQLQELKSKNEIISFSSIGVLVSSNKKQLQKIEKWNSFWNTKTINDTKKNLIDSGLKLGLKENTFSQFYKLLQTPFKPLQLAELDHISSLRVEDFMVSNAAGTTITSLIKVDQENAKKINSTFSNFPQTLLIDRKQVNETFLGNLKNDFNRLIWYSLLVVILLLAFFYQSLSLTLITTIPLFLSWLLTIGILAFFNIEFNIFNSIISSFIFGLGVDYCIFITNGLLTKYQTGIDNLVTHKTSIILSVLTTLLGIGVLVFAKHPALHSVAVVCVIGILSAVLISFTIQPLLFQLFIGSTSKRPITPRVLAHSLLSFGYFDLGGLLLSVYSWGVLKISPKAHLKKQMRLHQLVSKFMKSVLYTNPFLTKKIINQHHETFENPAMLIANHASFLDILALGMLHPKLIYLVKDHVYHSPILGSAVKLHGAYPVTGGIENGEAFLQHKVKQGFSIVAFPEGARSTTNKIHRFHKGAFYLAEKLGLDIIPVMIHGGAEVSPKGSFIIRNGSFTIKILDRIKANDTTFGETYSQRPKIFGHYFRTTFRKFRTQIEDENYWHPLLLENFKHKGKGIYKSVKQDLKKHKNTYKIIATFLGEKDSIIILSNSYGQLSLLLSLDAIDRKIYSFLATNHAKALLKNNYLTHQYSKINVVDTLQEALMQNASVLIIDTDIFSIDAIIKQKIEEITILILLSLGQVHEKVILENFEFEVIKKEAHVIIFKNQNDINSCFSKNENF